MPTIKNTKPMVLFNQPMIHSPQSPMKSAYTSPNHNNIAVSQANLKPTIQNTKPMVLFNQPMIHSPQSPMKSAYTSPNHNNIAVPQANLKPTNYNLGIN